MSCKAIPSDDLVISLDEKKPKCKTRTWRDTVKIWAETTTAHGIGEVAKSEKPFSWKLLWIIVISFSLLIMALSLGELICTYSQRKWTTTVFEEMWNISEHKPAVVTICNFNRLDRVKTDKFGFDPAMISYFFANSSDDYCFKHRMDTSVRERYTKWRLEHNATYKDVFKLVGHECEDTIPVAVYGSGEEYVPPCNKSNPQNIVIEHVYTKELGRCFQMTVNSTKPTNSRKAYAFYLRMEHEKMIQVVQNNYFEEGFVFHISTDRKVDMSSYGRIPMPPGFSASVRLKLHRTQLRGANEKTWFKLFLKALFMYDKPPCREHNIELKYFTNVKYSKESCVYDCTVGDHFYHNCHCIPVHTDREDSRVCEVEETDDCLQKFESRSASDRERQDACAVDCNDPCYAEYFTATSTLIEYPNEALMKPFRKVLETKFANTTHYTDRQLKRQFTNVKMHMDSLSTRVTEIYQDSTFEGLISSIGGTLGLWSGMSFITVFHAVLFFATASFAHRN